MVNVASECDTDDMDEVAVRAEERERAVRILAAMHPIAQKRTWNTCHWSDDKTEYLVCQSCTDGEYDFQPWPCDDLREFAADVGVGGDLRRFAVMSVLDSGSNEWVSVPASEVPTDTEMAAILSLT